MCHWPGRRVAGGWHPAIAGGSEPLRVARMRRFRRHDKPRSNCRSTLKLRGGFSTCRKRRCSRRSHGSLGDSRERERNPPHYSGPTPPHPPPHIHRPHPPSFLLLLLLSSSRLFPPRFPFFPPFSRASSNRQIKEKETLEKGDNERQKRMDTQSKTG